MVDKRNYGRPRGAEDVRGRQRDQEWGRGGWPSEDRGGYGQEDAYGYGREGQHSRPHDDDRRRDYGYGSEGSGERYGRPTAYGYGRQGDDFRSGNGGGFGGPGVGYYGQRDGQRGQYPGHDRERHAGHRDDDRDRGLLDRATDEVQSWFGDDDAARRRRLDEQRGNGDAGTAAGEYRGRGPRNYTRADDRVRDDINDRLSDDPHLDATDIEVAVAQGDVTLSGSVRDRFAKRHAEDIAERVSGVKNVQNNLRVQPASAPGTTDATRSGGAGTPGPTTRVS